MGCGSSTIAVLQQYPIEPEAMVRADVSKKASLSSVVASSSRRISTMQQEKPFSQQIKKIEDSDGLLKKEVRIDVSSKDLLIGSSATKSSRYQKTSTNMEQSRSTSLKKFFLPITPPNRTRNGKFVTQLEEGFDPSPENRKKGSKQPSSQRIRSLLTPAQASGKTSNNNNNLNMCDSEFVDSNARIQKLRKSLMVRVTTSRSHSQQANELSQGKRFTEYYSPNIFERISAMTADAPRTPSKSQSRIPTVPSSPYRLLGEQEYGSEYKIRSIPPRTVKRTVQRERLTQTAARTSSAGHKHSMELQEGHEPSTEDRASAGTYFRRPAAKPSRFLQSHVSESLCKQNDSSNRKEIEDLMRRSEEVKVQVRSKRHFASIETFAKRTFNLRSSLKPIVL